MDKFDEQIKAAHKAYEPKATFVDATMQRVAALKPRKRWSVKVWVPALAGTLAVVALIFVALPFGSHTVNSSNSNNTMPAASQTRSGTTSTVQGAANSAASGSTAAGTDNASLESDLNSVQSSMNQENNDQSGANNALNDQQNEIAVPTS